MKGVIWWRAVLFLGLVFVSVAIGRAEESEPILLGQRVAVVDLQAQFTIDGAPVKRAWIGSTFTVTDVEGDLLWVAGEGAFLHRFDVVPAEDADGYLNRKVADFPTPESYMERGYYSLDRNDFAGAAHDFTMLTRCRFYAPPGYICLGYVRYEQRKYDQAIADCNLAIGIDSEIQMAYVVRGQALCRVGQVDQGIDDLSKAIRMDPSDSDAFCLRGEAYTKKAKYRWALEDFQRAIELEPLKSRPYSSSARVYIAKGNIRQALDEFGKLMRVDRALGLNSRAWLQATSAEPTVRNGDAAFMDATEACDLSNWENAGYITTLSATLAEMGMFDEAVKTLERSIEQDPALSPETVDEMLTAFKARKPYRDDRE